MNDPVAQRKLFDIFTRQALFIEQVRVNEALLFNDVLEQIEKNFRKMLGLIKYESLGEMSKAQVQSFIKALRGSQTVIYSKYQRQLLARLQKFTEATVNQTVVVVGSYLDSKEKETIEPVGIVRAKNLIESEFKSNDESTTNGLFMLLPASAMLAKFWPILKNTPMPTGGVKLLDYVNTTMASNMMRVSQSVTTAWVNNLTVEELSAQVLGSPKTGQGNPNLPGGSKASELTKIRNATNAVTATVLQHVAQISATSVASTVWAFYQWLSVIDNRTSAICHYLNKKVFQYGKGPVPPAHPHCRSHTMPVVGSGATATMPGLLQWLQEQSDAFITTTFKASIANQLINGDDALRENISNLVKPITVDQFANRTDDLF